LKRDQQKKESQSKLKLNKETLRILTTDQLEAVRGGVPGGTSGNPVLCGGQSNVDGHECP
jgi:hypothetical protein